MNRDRVKVTATTSIYRRHLTWWVDCSTDAGNAMGSPDKRGSLGGRLEKYSKWEIPRF
jgi:hypothetical protein